MVHTIQLHQLLPPLLLLLPHASGQDGFTLVNIVLDLIGGSGAPYGECKGCFCIPEDIDDPSTCPSTVPRTDYADLIPILRSFQWENPYSLECDPYEDANCDTTPPLEAEGGACVVEFSGPTDGTCPDTWSYATRTYAGTFAEAVNDTSVVVTHATPCGACSSLQDLSVYMDQGGDLTEVSADCGFEGLFDKAGGIQCFESLGFTPGCAAAWYYNTKKTRSECFGICATTTSLEVPLVRPRDCELNRCLACDEQQAGPVFKRFAGRTRRNSGLRSHIARPCSAIVPLEHQNPCGPLNEEEDKIDRPTLSPNPQQTPSPTTRDGEPTTSLNPQPTPTTKPSDDEEKVVRESDSSGSWQPLNLLTLLVWSVTISMVFQYYS